MKTTMMKTALFTAAVIVSMIATVPAQSTWTGSGVNNNWNNTNNWDPVAVPGTSSTITFGEADSYTVDRNTTGRAASLLNFIQGAEAYTFIGERLQLVQGGGGVSNTSGETVTFESGFHFETWNGQNFYTYRGDIVVENGITGGASGYTILKGGIGTLTVHGADGVVSNPGLLRHQGGTLVLDEYAANLGGAASGVSLGGVDTPVLEIVGKATGTTTINKNSLGLSSAGRSASQIRLTANGGDGVVLNFTDETNALQNFAPQTLNVDLSSHAANSVTFASVNSGGATAMNNGIFRWATVTDTTGTGFATMDGTNFVRNTDTTPFTGADATANTTNYHVGDGTTTLTANRNTGSLTIHAENGGNISGAYNFQTGALLVQEKTKDYTINSTLLSPGTGTQLLIHQYSTDGALILKGDIFATNGTGQFIKAGPGTVEVADTGKLRTTGITYVQGGKLAVNGEIERSSEIRVFHTATLEGGGEIGTEAPSAVTIYAGGTLAGSTSAALDITGTLALESWSTFAFTLGAGTDFVNISGAITLQDDVNLSLALVGEPVLEADIYLLKSTTGNITGNFVYNNTVMTHGTAFTLNGHAFTYYQDDQNIWVQAIPEPSVALLVGLGTAFLLIRRRR